MDHRGRVRHPVNWSVVCTVRKDSGPRRHSGAGAARSAPSGSFGPSRRSAGVRGGGPPQVGRARQWVRQPYRPTAIATITFYGPDNRTAVKAVVRIYHHLDRAPVASRSFWGGDPRTNPQVRAAIDAFVQEHDAKQVVVADGIAGCPHVEGIDFPQGGVCPRCGFWRRAQTQGG